jgi:hypothetical protein
MSDRNQIMGVLFVAATSAILTLALPVEAQVPSMSPSTAPVIKPADTVNLTMEQRHIIKEIIIKDMKITEPADQAAKVPTQVGQKIPSGIALQPMPVEVAAKVPQLKSHSFVVKNQQVVIVDPKDNKVAALIE